MVTFRPHSSRLKTGHQFPIDFPEHCKRLFSARRPGKLTARLNAYAALQFSRIVFVADKNLLTE